VQTEFVDDDIMNIPPAIEYINDNDFAYNSHRNINCSNQQYNTSLQSRFNPMDGYFPQELHFLKTKVRECEELVAALSNYANSCCSNYHNNNNYQHGFIHDNSNQNVNAISCCSHDALANNNNNNGNDDSNIAMSTSSNSENDTEKNTNNNHNQNCNCGCNYYSFNYYDRVCYNDKTWNDNDNNGCDFFSKNQEMDSSILNNNHDSFGMISISNYNNHNNNNNNVNYGAVSNNN